MRMSAGEANTDTKQIVSMLQAAGKKLDDGAGEVVLDFSTVPRVDIGAVNALEDLVRLAEVKTAKVALRDVNIDVYKVLKLVKLDSKLSFLNGIHGQRSMNLENFHAEPSAK